MTYDSLGRKPDQLQPEETIKLPIFAVHHVNLDLSRTQREGYRDADDLLISELSSLDLYKEVYAYSIAPPDLFEGILTHGTYRFGKDGRPKQSVFCMFTGKNDDGSPILAVEESITEIDRYDWEDYIDSNYTKDGAAIPLIVYDLAKLTKDFPNRKDHEYRFLCSNKCDALVAVVMLENY